MIFAITNDLYYDAEINISFCIVTACAGGRTKQRENLHLSQTGISFVIFTFSWYTEENLDIFSACQRSGAG